MKNEPTKISTVFLVHVSRIGTGGIVESVFVDCKLAHERRDELRRDATLRQLNDGRAAPSIVWVEELPLADV